MIIKICQTRWDTTKAVLMSNHCQQRRKSRSNDLCFYLEELWREEQIEPERSRREKTVTCQQR